MPSRRPAARLWSVVDGGRLVTATCYVHGLHCPIETRTRLWRQVYKSLPLSSCGTISWGKEGVLRAVLGWNPHLISGGH